MKKKKRSTKERLFAIACTFILKVASLQYICSCVSQSGHRLPQRKNNGKRLKCETRSLDLSSVPFLFSFWEAYGALLSRSFLVADRLALHKRMRNRFILFLVTLKEEKKKAKALFLFYSFIECNRWQNEDGVPLAGALLTLLSSSSSYYYYFNFALFFLSVFAQALNLHKGAKWNDLKARRFDDQCWSSPAPLFTAAAPLCPRRNSRLRAPSCTPRWPMLTSTSAASSLRCCTNVLPLHWQIIWP